MVSSPFLPLEKMLLKKSVQRSSIIRWNVIEPAFILSVKKKKKGELGAKSVLEAAFRQTMARHRGGGDDDGTGGDDNGNDDDGGAGDDGGDGYSS
jgi:hypothetical protein